MIDAQELCFSYGGPQGSRLVLDHLTFHIEKGQFVALLGHNGCGKSTLARHFNCLLPLQHGSLKIAGLDASEEINYREIRRICGMVFQDPDNQFVSSLVEEDLAFGLRNYEVPEEEIPRRVAEALKEVGLPNFQKRTPQFLSGGQKQRLALAGVLVLAPELIVLDEASSMLDGQGRRELMQVLHHLHKTGKTIIMISHEVDEALDADRVLILNHGRLTADGTPKEVLTDLPVLQEAGLQAPYPVRCYYALKEAGLPLQHCPISSLELTNELCRLRSKM